jgi:hypothetical protein
MFLFLLGATLMVVAGHEGAFNGLSLIGLMIIGYAVFRRFREERSNV